MKAEEATNEGSLGFNTKDTPRDFNMITVAADFGCCQKTQFPENAPAREFLGHHTEPVPPVQLFC
jgi:hypothetical protein